MRVLISGAGVAGLTLAYWLKRYGCTPTIVERAPFLPTGGYKIDVRGTALEVLARMNIRDKVASSTTDMQRGLHVDKQGKVILEMDGATFGHREGDDLEIIRGSLCEILKEEVADIECFFGDSIEAIAEESSAICAIFNSGQKREFDLLVGADGLHSNVRRIAFGEEVNFLRHLGLYLCVYSVPNDLHLDREEIECAEIGRFAAIWSSSGDEDAKACFAFASPLLPNLDRQNREEIEQHLRDAFEGINWEVPKLLDRISQAKDFYFDSAAQIEMKSWSKGRVVLLGDAAYCASPMSGQGTSLALIGAYILAGELAEAMGAYHTAFDRYEEKMRPFVTMNQEFGKKSAALMRSEKEKKLAHWIFALLSKIAPGRLNAYFINRATRRIAQAANAITLKEYRKG